MCTYKNQLNLNKDVYKYVYITRIVLLEFLEDPGKDLLRPVTCQICTESLQHVREALSEKHDPSEFLF